MGTRRQFIEQGAGLVATATVGFQPKEAEAFFGGIIIGVLALAAAIAKISLELADSASEFEHRRRLRQADMLWLRQQRKARRAERRQMRVAPQGRYDEGLDVTVNQDFFAKTVNRRGAGEVDAATAVGIGSIWAREKVLLVPKRDGRFEDDRGNEWYKVSSTGPSPELQKEAGDYLDLLFAEADRPLNVGLVLSRNEIDAELRSLNELVGFRRASA